MEESREKYCCHRIFRGDRMLLNKENGKAIGRFRGNLYYKGYSFFGNGGWKRMYKKRIKGVIAFSLALILLLVLSPLIIVIWFLVKVDEPRAPAIFKQIRCGKDLKPFILYKFRSLKSSAPHEMSTHDFTDRGDYMSKWGKFLRKSSLDELPQLFNILKGEMCFIGPRPVIYSEEKLIHRRNELGAYRALPGITGYAQISGRDDLSIEAKAQCDAHYVNNISLKEDLKILLKTVPITLKEEGNQE